MSKRTIKILLILLFILMLLCCIGTVLVLTGQMDPDVAGQFLGLGGLCFGSLVCAGLPLAIVIFLVVKLLRKKGIMS